MFQKLNSSDVLSYFHRLINQKVSYLIAPRGCGGFSWSSNLLLPPLQHDWCWAAASGRHKGGGDSGGGGDAVAQSILDMSVVIIFSYRKGLGSDGVWADCILHQIDCIPKAVLSVLCPHDAALWALQLSLYTVAFNSTSETPIQLKRIPYKGIPDVFLPWVHNCKLRF